MKINPFIFSQRGEAQNDTILLADPINKDELNTYLYSIFEKENPRKTFYRAFKMKKSIVVVLYWYTNHREIASGRSGLFVVAGFILDGFRAKGVPDGLDWFCRQYFDYMEKCYQMSLNDAYGDRLFEQFQNTQDSRAERLLEYASELRSTISDFRGGFNLFHSPKKTYRGRKRSMIYLLNDKISFADRWSAFCRESLAMLRAGDRWDVSTLPEYTPQSIVIYENGSRMPSDFEKAAKVRNRDLQYLVMWN